MAGEREREYANGRGVRWFAVVFDRGVALYFSANFSDTATIGTQYAWGIWRAVLGPATNSRAYGTDFVVRPLSDTDPGGTRDLVVRSNEADDAGFPFIVPLPTRWDSISQMRLDPDPVRLPSGEWVVFTGSQGPYDPVTQQSPNFYLERFESGEANAERSFRDAWLP